VVQRRSKLIWIGGAFLFDDHNEGRVAITVFPVTQIRPFAKIGTDAGALFGQATYSLSSRVSVTGGVRYTRERKELDSIGGVYRIGTDILLDPATFYDFIARKTFDAWTPKLSVQIQASPSTFAYVSATRGFKSGGFNPAARVPAVAAFYPELAWSYEAGLKRTMAGRRVTTNMAVFHTNYRDLQVLSFLQPGVPDISNAGSATIRGVEVEVDAAAGHGLRLGGHLSWLEATYDRYLARVTGGGTRDAAGNRLNNAPEWSGSGSAVYEFAAWQRGTVRLRGDVSWQSRVFFTPSNDAIETQGGYGLVRLRAGFEPRTERWEIAVYMRNVANTDYITATANHPIPAYAARPGEPRHWGTQFTLRP
jgi:iron complex outermembrane receptor protein